MTPAGALESVARAVHPLYPSRDRVYLNAASWGLLPTTAIEASTSLTQRRNGTDPVSDAELFDTLHEARSAAAEFVGVQPRQVVLSPNTSFGVNLAAALTQRTKSPGAIVMSDGEFPANVYPWLALERHGFEVRRIPTLPNGWPDESALMAALDAADVRALALSSVQFSTGYRADLAALGARCRERDILFAVDAIQELGAGTVLVEELGVDVLACGAQKWLCSPWGSGFAYIAPRHHDAFDPPMVSWLGFANATDFENMLGYTHEFLDSGRKFELATLGVQDYAALGASIRMFLDAGPAACRRYVLSVQQPLIDWIDSRNDVELTSPRPEERRAGILMFRPPDVHGTLQRLHDHGVVCVIREGSIRLSPHVYTTEAEIAYVLELLEG